MLLTKYQIDQLRDAAVLLEKNHVKAAYDLMRIAHEARPNGALIKAKLAKYESKIQQDSDSGKKFHQLLKSGELVIIPTGFRCFTKRHMLDDLGIKQPSMPFDNGFFPPNSIAKILESGEVDLMDTEGRKNHTVCVKKENQRACGNRSVIKFESSSYEELDRLIKSRDQKGLGRYLDATFGYYTLDVKKNYVLAHYNWHPYAKNTHSNGITDPAQNLPIINSMLNKRISRMMEACRAARHVVFAVGEFQDYSHMIIDAVEHDLHDYKLLSETVRAQFGNQCTVINYNEVDTFEKMLALLD